MCMGTHKYEVVVICSNNGHHNADKYNDNSSNKDNTVIIMIINNKQNDINNNDKYVEAYKKKEYVRWVQKNCDIGTKLPASEKAFHNSSHHMLWAWD